MSNKLHLRMLPLFLALIFSTNIACFGCWCRDAGPVLGRVESSKSVVVGRLVSVGGLDAKIVVERVYKGALRVGDQLSFEQGQFTDCIRRFDEKEIGQEYLFYLGNSASDDTYAASVCGRSDILAQAFDDLAYLDKIGEVAGKTRLSGYFKTNESNAPDLEGLVIKITGKRNKKIYSLRTDKNGFFEIYDLSPEDYIIEPQVPKGWRIDAKYMFGADDGRSVTTYIETVKLKRHTLSRITIVKNAALSE